jgi:tRNA (cmo5U34)-methyltransferase
MADRWHDPEFAAAWDRVASAGHPLRAEQLDLLLTVVARHYRPGTAILDLGIGSGQVEALLFERLPGAEVVGVDGSAAMLALARERLATVADRCTLLQCDFAGLAGLRLPARAYGIVVSVQALHHVPHAVQRAAVRYAHAALAPGGLFLLMERIRLDAAPLAGVYAALWERLERVSGVAHDWNPARYLQRLAEGADHVAAVEDHLAWLREAGFAAACLDLRLDRALLAGVKAS